MITVRFSYDYFSNSFFLIILDCYQRLFGPKGVGYGIGSGTLSTGN
jgi:hypothetical protein